MAVTNPPGVYLSPDGKSALDPNGKKIEGLTPAFEDGICVGFDDGANEEPAETPAPKPRRRRKTTAAKEA